MQRFQIWVTSTKQWYSNLSIDRSIVVAVGTSAAILCLVLLVSYTLRPYNSDDVAVQRVMQTLDNQSANYAVVGTDNFLLRIPLYLLFDFILPNSTLKLLLINFVLNSIFFIGLIAVTIAICRPYFTDKLRVWLALLPVTWYLGLIAGEFTPKRVDMSLGTMTAFMNPNYRTAEIGIILMIIAIGILHFTKVKSLFDILGRNKRTIGISTSAFILLSLLFFSDPFFIYTLGAATCITLCLGWLSNRLSTRQLFLPITIVLLSASIGKKILSNLTELTGIIPIDNVEKLFIALPLLLNNMSNATWGLFTLFHADFWDNFLTQGRTLVYISNSFLLFLCIGSIIYLTVNAVKSRRPRWAVLFFLSAIYINIAAFIATVHGSHIENYRYLFMSSIFMLPLLSYSFMQIKTNNVRPVGVIITIFLISISLNTALNVKMTANAIQLNKSVQNSHNLEQLKVIQIIESNKLTKGYSDYWDANIMTYLSNNRLSILPVSCTDYQMMQYHWFVNTVDYKRAAQRTYYIKNNDNVSNIITACDLNREFGNPSKIIEVSPKYSLLIYDKDIIIDAPIYKPIARTSK